MRGPGVLPEDPRTTVGRTRRQRFDDLVLDVVADVDRRWQDRLGLVEYAVEDTPQLPDDWDERTVPLASLVRGSGTEPTRLVLDRAPEDHEAGGLVRGSGTEPTRLVVFRRPVEHRAETRAELEALVLTIVVEQVAELLGIDAEDVDPRYRSPDD